MGNGPSDLEDIRARLDRYEASGAWAPICQDALRLISEVERLRKYEIKCEHGLLGRDCHACVE